MTRRWTVVVTWVVLVFAAGGARAAWFASLSTSNVPSGSAIAGAEHSSTALDVAWSAAPSVKGYSPVSYQIRYVDGVTGSTSVRSVPGGVLSTRLVGLKASTTYAVHLRACYNAACTLFDVASDSGVTSTTYEETWQISDDGSTRSMACSYDRRGIPLTTTCSITNVISDSGTKAAGYLDGAGNGYLYYHPASGTSRRVSIGWAAAGALYSVTNYSSATINYGLDNPGGASGDVHTINTSAPVPLATGGVRLFFEATPTSSSGTSRVLYLDSDGGSNHDFNGSAAGTLCNSYGPGSPCEASVAIGMEVDDAVDFYGIAAARQLRVGYRHQLGSWNLADGTFMVFTVNLTSSGSNCLGEYGLAATTKTQGYAQYSASSGEWVVELDPAHAGCPRIFEDMQAPSLVHLGSAAFKLYYGTPSVPSGEASACGLPWLGPKRMMYADGAVSGGASTVEHEDWEGTGSQRDVRFVWPDGTLLSDRAEGYIDDFEFMARPGDLLSQHAYLTITDGNDAACVAPFITYATLVNP